MNALRPEFCSADRRRPNQSGHSTNLLGVPTGWLSSVAFNDEPVALHLMGVRSTNRSLFEMLEDSDGAEDAALAFETYMEAVFGLDPEQKSKHKEEGPRRYRSSYYRLLRGWGHDSNGPEGAVLKGWVESRFGLFPTFHKEPLTTLLDEPWMAYVCEKMSSRFHN
ncbi:MAG: NAD(+)--dinitrogen-reductase ADP-D-ribosyltransferase, partial [Rhodospirillaceae bacterium]